MEDPHGTEDPQGTGGPCRDGGAAAPGLPAVTLGVLVFVPGVTCDVPILQTTPVIVPHPQDYSGHSPKGPLWDCPQP